MGRGNSGSTTYSRDKETGRKIRKFDEPGLEDIEFIVPRGISKSVVLVDVNKLEEAFKDSFQYIPPGGGGAEIKGRREDFRNFLKKGKPVELSQIYVDKQGKVSFVDGRHRYTVLRDDRKVKKVPVAVDPANIARVRKFLE